MSEAKSKKNNSIGIKNGQSQIIVRFPPSPTGLFHVGNARTALFNYLFAKKNNGKLLFRLEDTDAERSKKEYEDDIIEGLKWLGIEMDFNNIVRQSERKNIYKKYLQKMIDEGHAYLSNDENIEEGKRAEVIRFKNPNKKIKFNDLIRGEIEFDTTELKDFVIAKSLEEPVYHLAVVVDDFEMGVSHIIRGEDGISNTPRQILIQESIGAPRPVYAHLPLVLAEDRSKLSKRKHGEIVSLSYYRQRGYLPEAMINFLALLGWNPGTDQEIFSMQELIGQFNLSRVQKSGAIFNIEKLNWINSEYIKKMGEDELLEKCIPFIKITNHKLQITKLKKILKIKQERMNNLAEAGDEISYFFEQPEYKKELLLWKQEKSLDKTKQHLEKISEMINEIEENNFVSHNIKEKVWEYAEEQGRGNALWPLRVALTGLDKSPEPFIVAEILGKKETLNRIKNAVKKI